MDTRIPVAAGIKVPPGLAEVDTLECGLRWSSDAGGSTSCIVRLMLAADSVLPQVVEDFDPKSPS